MRRSRVFACLRNSALDVGSDLIRGMASRLPSTRRTVTFMSPAVRSPANGIWRIWHAVSQGHIAAGQFVHENGMSLTVYLRLNRLRLLLLRIAVVRPPVLRRIRRVLKNSGS